MVNNTTPVCFSSAVQWQLDPCRGLSTCQSHSVTYFYKESCLCLSLLIVYLNPQPNDFNQFHCTVKSWIHGKKNQGPAWSSENLKCSSKTWHVDVCIACTVTLQQQMLSTKKCEKLEGWHGESFTSRVGGALGDVLLSGRPVNVPHHTLHHPLDAFVHSIPATQGHRLLPLLSADTFSALVWWLLLLFGFKLWETGSRKKNTLQVLD